MKMCPGLSCGHDLQIASHATEEGSHSLGVLTDRPVTPCRQRSSFSMGHMCERRAHRLASSRLTPRGAQLSLRLMAGRDFVVRAPERRHQPDRHARVGDRPLPPHWTQRESWKLLRRQSTRAAWPCDARQCGCAG